MVYCFSVEKIYNKNNMRIPIVNEQDEIIEIKDRDKVVQEDVYRVSSLWITNSKGGILLARRAFHKRQDAGKWGPAVAGTVDEGETYEQNIIKEAEEEIGLTNFKPILDLKLRSRGKNNYFVQRFSLVLDKDITEFKIKPDEVAEIKWFAPEKLRKELQEHPDNFLKGIHDRMKE